MLHQTNKRVLICIHGFGRLKSYDFSAFKRYANHFELDYDIVTFDLYNPTDPNPKFDLWLKRAFDTVEMYSKLYDEVNLLGFSMGGVIATHVASRVPHIARLILVSPAFRFGNWESFKHLKTNTEEHAKVAQVSVARYLSDRKMIPSYIAEFARGIKRIRNSDVHCRTDVIVFASPQDEIIPYSCSEEAIVRMKGKY
ncbi:MAG: alpha/beta hydrolase, partial [Erysipelotrichaceae bacterium]